MKLSISNIGWESENDCKIYGLMKKMGMKGLEIAPTRVFSDNPYDRCIEANKWAKRLHSEYGFEISSMQSIWYGKDEKLFGTEEERKALLEYTKKAIDFAEAMSCGNIVFGCPRNRNKPEWARDEIAIDFFSEIGDYAAKHGTVVALEANPTIYNTNYITDTKSAIETVRIVKSKGFLFNLDIGTMIENGEEIMELRGNENLINHVHVSEPRLKTIMERKLHLEIKSLLYDYGYDKFISIEVGKQNDMDNLEKMMDYVYNIFGD